MKIGLAMAHVDIGRTWQGQATRLLAFAPAID